ncbi:MAG TPA: hypothetical protein PKD61_20520 [Polyangiaceae bacterium]|nr:hypothetical protein [Polyangiaceae bacterium]
MFDLQRVALFALASGLLSACGTRPQDAPQVATVTAPAPAPAKSTEPAPAESASVVASKAPSPDLPKDPDPHAQERAVAKTAGEKAIRAAGFSTWALDTGMQPQRETSPDRTLWRFAVFTDQNEQVGWLLVTTEGVVTIEALEQELSLADYKRLRAQQAVMSKRLASLPVIRSYCQWVEKQTGMKGCLFWIEGAPALDCKPAAKSPCFWQAYVGSDNGLAAARHFTLLVDAGNGALFVQELDGVVPLKKWRRSQPF